MSLAVSARGGPREDSYLQERCLPLVRAFIQKQAIAYDSLFPTGKIVFRRVDFSDESDVAVARVSLEKRLAFVLIGDGKTNAVTYFSDRTNWKPAVMEPGRESEIRALAGQSNLLNHVTALVLARELFRLQGHREENFHPVEFQQMVWTEAAPQKRIPLPFYEARWARRDVKLPLHEQPSIYPSVRLVVSGVISNLVEYEAIALRDPVSGK